MCYQSLSGTTLGGAFVSFAAEIDIILRSLLTTPFSEVIAECALDADIPHDVLRYVQCPEIDVGKHFISISAAVILKKLTETAKLFYS